jgi:hypothetical protein
MTVTAHFSKTVVVKAYVDAIVVPAMDLLETDNRRQERGPAGVNEDSAYCQPPPPWLGQQELGV